MNSFAERFDTLNTSRCVDCEEINCLKPLSHCPVCPTGQTKPSDVACPVVPSLIKGTTGQASRTNFGSNSTEDTHTLDVSRRKTLLETYRQKQPFRVSIGKSKWIPYDQFDERYNLREILNDEIVIEFDCDDPAITIPATSFTGLNLYLAGYKFDWWDHGGKSPHLHVHNLPIRHLDPQKRKAYKTLFIKRYVPAEFLKYADKSLTGIHLIALEWANHWKGKYGVKQLVGSYNGVKDSQ